ncbi:MAG: hypothetical protein ACI4TB_09260, partial [Lachnospiraceae bacterium]
MTQKQYKDANTTAYPLVMVIFGYFLITLIAAVLSTGGTWRIFLQIAATVVTIVLSTVTFLLKRN